MDPARIAHDPRDGNLWGHWILTIIDEDKDNVYVMDPLGARHSQDAWKTVLNNGIKAFNAQIRGRPRKLSTWIMFSYRARRKDTYTQMELDEVREELATHVLEWLFD
ncbi:PREDICTED: PRUPE_7G026800 [Prunus dulcis]|uniref:PREDICTED: PRUPE_7G026800 n=1 Tax=Prunus dulcis TaxID=3755 RepID=A0A5E4GH68_PRUDU|nr:PREDICTED: PRUPE_7G026800 [Prunus dulcis]